MTLVTKALSGLGEALVLVLTTPRPGTAVLVNAECRPGLREERGRSRERHPLSRDLQTQPSKGLILEPHPLCHDLQTEPPAGRIL